MTKEEMRPEIAQAVKTTNDLDRDDTEDTISEGWEKVVDPDKDEWEMIEELKF